MKKIFNFDAVAKGRCTVIYSSWSECLSQVDGYKHNSFKGFNTLDMAVNFMVTAGISVQDIEYFETEGEVIMKKPLLSVKPNIIEEITKIDIKTQIKARSTSTVESQQEQGVQCISIDGSCKKNGTVKCSCRFWHFLGRKPPK